MTNEKVIEILTVVKDEYLHRGTSADDKAAKAVEYAMEVINENAELKTEIECLKADISAQAYQINHQEGQIDAYKYCLERMGKTKDYDNEKQIPDDIYEKAVIKFGKTPQLIMAMEEMSELIQALSKDIRGKHNENNISEEIADVEIMLAQLKIIYQNDAEVEKWKTDKLFRLQARIEEV